MKILTGFRTLLPKRQNELVVINYYYADDETVSYTFLEDGWITSAILFDFLSEFSPKISPSKIWYTKFAPPLAPCFQDSFKSFQILFGFSSMNGL